MNNKITEILQIDVIIEIFKSSNLIKDQRQFDRYIKLINSYKLLNIKKKRDDFGGHERHHILPVAMFPEYKKNKSNLVTFPSKAHYLAHYFLYKSINHRSCIFAFNQMRRISLKYGKHNCRLYAASRIDLAKAVSECNTGRVVSQATKDVMSALHSGINTYRNKETLELRRLKIGTEPEGWEAFQNGRVLTEKTRFKMHKSQEGRMWQYNLEKKEVKFLPYQEEGFTLGAAPWVDHSCDILKTYSWLYNETTGHAIRINIDITPIPDGYVIGRSYNNVGLKVANDANVTRVVDLQEKKYCLVDKSILPNSRYCKQGVKIENVYLIKFEGLIYSNFTEFNNRTGIPINGTRDISMLNRKVPGMCGNPRGSELRNAFCIKYRGKTYKECGIEIFPLSSYTYNEKDLHARCR